MFTDIESLYNSLDFTEYDYFYHITGRGNGESIIEKGLLVEGSNIINANNLLFTTTIEITEELTPTLEDFIALIEENSYISRLRDTSEMVILAAPKDYNKELIYGSY